MIPVVGDTVQYTKKVVPRAGPAIGGRIEIHAALVLKVARSTVGAIVPGSQHAGEAWTCDLKVLDPDGDVYMVRTAKYAPWSGTEEAVGCWTDRPATDGARLEHHAKVAKGK
jgi:hypothetical protein